MFQPTLKKRLCGYVPFPDDLGTGVHCSDSLKSPRAIYKMDLIGFTYMEKDAETGVWEFSERNEK